jgi:hypothetical protein
MKLQHFFSKLLPQPLQPLAEALGVPEFKELRITTMGGLDPAGMLDRAPVLLGARRDLSGEGGDPVSVGTVETVEFLDDVQIGEVLAVEDEVIRPSGFGDAVDGKADDLIDGEEEIQEEERDEPRIDERSGNYVEGPRLDDVTEQSGLEPSLLAGHLLGKPYPFFFYDKLELLPFQPELFLQLLLKLPDPANKLVDLLGHEVSDQNMNYRPDDLNRAPHPTQGKSIMFNPLSIVREILPTPPAFCRRVSVYSGRSWG